MDYGWWISGVAAVASGWWRSAYALRGYGVTRWLASDQKLKAETLKWLLLFSYLEWRIR